MSSINRSEFNGLKHAHVLLLISEHGHAIFYQPIGPIHFEGRSDDDTVLHIYHCILVVVIEQR